MSKVQVKIKKLSDNAVIPIYAHGIDSGMDLTAASLLIDEKPHYGYYEYGLGFSVSIPKDYVGLIFPRSSISKTGMILANSIGVIDPGYLGEVKCRFKYIKGTKAYEVGDKIAQLIIIPRPQIEFVEVTELEQSERGQGGFGSTGV